MDYEWISVSSLLGYAVGCPLALIYLYYAWYDRDESGKDPRKGVKVKALGILTGQCLVSYVIAENVPSAQQFFIALPLASFSGVFLGVMALTASAAVMGFSEGKLQSSRLSCALDYGMVALFQGVKVLLAKRATSEMKVHIKSKNALSRFVFESNELIGSVENTRSNLKQFESNFNSIISSILHSFFEHNDQNHRNYCAAYYKFSDSTKSFHRIALKSGNPQNKIGKCDLQENSIAGLSLNEGRVILWPDDCAQDKIVPIPAVKRKKLKEFLCIPVPPNENLKGEHRKGILCIDSYRKKRQFNDEYHLRILLFTAQQLAKLDELTIKEDQSWQR